MKPKTFTQLNESYDNKSTYTQEEVYAIAADIRNKLGPMKNLVALLRKQKEVTDPVLKEKMQKYIDSSIEQSDISITYLTNFITDK